VFSLTPALLAQHRGGQILALAANAVGRNFALSSTLPSAIAAPSAPTVAVVTIRGPLAQRAEEQVCGIVDGYDAIEARLDAALASADAVVLDIDSPGGDAAGCFEACRRMAAKVEASGKDVFAFANEMAASGAFAIAMVANRGVYLPPEGCVGSVGVISLHVEQVDHLAQSGVTPTVFRAPARKAEGLPVERLTDDARARIQGTVDAFASQFFDLVAEARGMSADDVAALEGLCFYGQKAVAVGLADGVASFDDVVNMAAASAAERSKDVRKDSPMFAALAAALMLTADATDDQVKAAIEAAGPTLALGRVALEVSGEKDPARAEGALRAAVMNAAELSKQAQARAEADAKAKAEAEQRERVELVTKLVASGRIAPAKAWAAPKTKDGEVEIVGAPTPSAGLAEPWASMKVETLRAMSAAIEPIEMIKTPARATVGAGVQPDDVEKAKSLGVKVETLIATREQMARAFAAQAGG